MSSDDVIVNLERNKADANALLKSGKLNEARDVSDTEFHLLNDSVS